MTSHSYVVTAWQAVHFVHALSATVAAAAVAAARSCDVHTPFASD